MNLRDERNERAVKQAYAAGDIDVAELEAALALILRGEVPDLPCCSPFDSYEPDYGLR